MRKGWLLLLTVLAGLMLMALPACAEIFVLDDISASVDIPANFVVLTPKNVLEYEAWLEGRGKNADDTALDFERRGVVLQCWDTEDTVCFEVRSNQTPRSQQWFDINEQSTQIRGQYRLSHYPNNEYAGYEFSTSEWKNTPNGRFLTLRYVRREGGEVIYKGFMRRTIRNGYEIDLDYQVYDRKETSKDNNALNKIWNTLNFIELKELPAAASAKIHFTEEPPAETKLQSFSIDGTASEGVQFTAVTMGLSYPDPVVSTYVVGKNGKFSMPVRLPREGVFLVTLTAEYKGQEVLEQAYPVTYQHTLLTVNFKTKPEAVVTEDEVKFTGTAEEGASIQIFVNEKSVDNKHVTPQGKFAITVDCEDEGAYDVMLCFSKKGLADRRFAFNFTRKWNDADMLAYLKKQAIAPSYGQLIKKINAYAGRVMGYKAYITDIAQSGDQYVLTLSLSKKKEKYINTILVTSAEKPAYEIGSRVWMYGTCEGLSLPEGENTGTQPTGYPCFNLLMMTSMDSK